jgi:hypothetical protein
MLSTPPPWNGGKYNGLQRYLLPLLRKEGLGVVDKGRAEGGSEGVGVVDKVRPEKFFMDIF